MKKRIGIGSWIVTLAAATLTACGGGHVEIHENPPPPGVSVFEAVTSARTAMSEQEQVELAARIRARAQANFDWASFWSTLLNERQSLSFSGAGLEALLDLHDMACQTSAFRSFGRFASEYAEGREYLVSERVRCPNEALGAEVTQRIVSERAHDARVSGRASMNDVVIALIAREFRNASPSDWHYSLSAIDRAADWSSVIEAAEGGESRVSMLAEVALAGGGAGRLEGALLGRYLETEDGFLRASEQVGTERFLELLVRAPRERIQSLSSESLVRLQAQIAEAIIARIGAHALKSPQAAMGAARLHSRWLSRLVGIGDTAALLRLEGKITSLLIEHTRLAPEKWGFLHELAGSSALATYTALRAGLIDREALRHQAIRLSEGNWMEQIALARLRVLLNTLEPAKLRETMSRYCELLDRAGLPETRLNQAPSDWESAASLIGCVRVTPPRPDSADASDTGSSVTWSADKIVLPHDLLVRLPGVDLTLRGATIEGGMFDLTAIQTKPEFRVPPAPAFPVVAGISVSDEVGSQFGISDGLYLFAAHGADFSAIESAPEPMRGFRGGHLLLEGRVVTEGTAPILLSGGAPGQRVRFESRQRPSWFAGSRLRVWAGALRYSGPAELETVNNWIGENNASIRRLMDLGDRTGDNGALQIFVDPSYLFYLPAEVRAEALGYCLDPYTASTVNRTNAGSFPRLLKCLERFARSALLEAVTELDRPETQPGELLERLSERWMPQAPPADRIGAAGDEGRVIPVDGASGDLR